MDVVFLLTAQVDVAVQLLPVLPRTSKERHRAPENLRGTEETRGESEVKSPTFFMNATSCLEIFSRLIFSAATFGMIL